MRAGKFTLFCALAATLAAAQSSPGQAPRARPSRHKAVAGKREAARVLRDVSWLIGTLKARGLSVGRAGGVSQPFFSVGGQALDVDGQNVQVFRYRTAEAARKEAARVSPDGSGAATSLVSWTGPPHFYRKDNLIVLHVGDDPKLTDALRTTLGPQFAGR